MKKNLILFFLLISITSFSQEYLEYSLSKLRVKIDKTISGLITRDDEVSMDIMNFYLNADGGKYIIDIIINYYIQDFLGNRNLNKSQNIILNQIIENTNEGKTNFLGGNYKEIFGPTNLNNSNLIQINIGVTKIDGKENIFANFGELLDEASPTTKTVNTVFKILGINRSNYEQNKSRLISSSEINVPLNFVEYGLEQNSERPYLMNNKTFGVPFQITVDLDNPSNLKRLGVNILNTVTSWINGGYPINVDKENVVGGLTIKFTKDKNLSFPNDIVEKLENFSEDIYMGDYTQDIAIAQADKLKEFIKEKLNDKEITKKMADNAYFYILLCKNYIVFKELNDLSKIDSYLLNRYNKWNTYAYNISTNWGFRKLGISGIYDDYTIKIKKTELNYKRYAKMYLPYSLTNKLILHSTTMQEEIHKYFAKFININNDKNLVANAENLFYDKKNN